MRKRESGENPERCRHCVWELLSRPLGDREGEAVMIKVRRTALTWNFRTAVHSACILITRRCYFCNDPEIARLWEIGSCIYVAAFLRRFSAADPCSILAEIQKKKRIKKISNGTSAVSVYDDSNDGIWRSSCIRRVYGGYNRSNNRSYNRGRIRGFR